MRDAHTITNLLKSVSQLFKMNQLLEVFKSSLKTSKQYSAPFYNVNITGTCHWAGQFEMSLNQFHALLIHELVGRQDLTQHGSAGCECFQNLGKTLTPFRQNREESGAKNTHHPKPFGGF